MEKRDDCIVVRSLEELFSVLKEYSEKQVYVIGGACIYKLLLPYCDEVIVTKVDAVGGADTFFENLDNNKNFVVSNETAPIETNGYTIKFVTYKNLTPQT
jgi:dihydrofolate reductase